MPKRPHWIDNPLRDYRYKNRLLQVEAAKRCGIDHTMWSLLENLKRSPSVEVLARISKRTGIPAEDLVKFFARRIKARAIRGSGVDLRDRIET